MKWEALIRPLGTAEEVVVVVLAALPLRRENILLVVLLRVGFDRTGYWY